LCPSNAIAAQKGCKHHCEYLSCHAGNQPQRKFSIIIRFDSKRSTCAQATRWTKWDLKQACACALMFSESEAQQLRSAMVARLAKRSAAARQPDP
jgi:hypothetical protein